VAVRLETVPLLVVGQSTTVQDVYVRLKHDTKSSHHLIFALSGSGQTCRSRSFTPAATSPCAPEHFLPGKWTCEVVEVSCVDPMFHIIRSDGLTMVQFAPGSRTAHVVPSKAALVAGDVDMEVPINSRDPTTRQSTHSGIARARVSNDVEMKDV
jgi:hypothetical protein